MRLFTLPEIEEFWNTKWKEAREESYALNLGNTTASATLVGYIDAKDYALAVASILGYSVGIVNGPTRILYRVAPVCHPRVRNLYASSVRITPYAFAKAGDIMGARDQKEVSPVKRHGRQLFSLDKESYNIVSYTSSYKTLRVEIDFSEFVGVTFASNGQPNFDPDFMDLEYKRYTQIVFDHGLEILQMDNAANLVFDSGPATNQAFPTPIGIMLPQGKLYIKWMWVPSEFITDTLDSNRKSLYNKTIQNCLGKVNKYRFLSFREGTLLFNSLKTEPVVIPVAYADMNLVTMKLAWNIEMDFLCLDTVAAEHYPVGPETSWRIYGHNVFPYRGDGKFYPASIRKDNVPGPGKALYEAEDFGKMFLTQRRVQP